jgi:hypothetical protein
MDDTAIENWAREFVENLVMGGEQVRLDRMIAAHLTPFVASRAKGAYVAGDSLPPDTH